ncbi:MAG TPA: class I SAM-dependent methyltransferase [Nitriliruptorales bacterium]
MFRRTANVYDLIYRATGKDYAAEATQLTEQIRDRQPAARTLLDVACGTGGHLVHLADTFTVAGVDLDPGMLAHARAKLPGVELVEADMRRFDLGRSFDVVVCLFSSIGYMRDSHELDQAVARMTSHLSPGGVLVIDGWVRPQAWRAGPDGRGGPHLDVAEGGDGLLVARIVRTRRDGNAVLMDMDHLVATIEGVDHVVDQHRVTLFTDGEYRGALDAAGLTVERLDSPMPDRDRYIGVKPQDGAA